MKGGQGRATGMYAANDAVDKTEEEIEDDGQESVCMDHEDHDDFNDNPTWGERVAQLAVVEHGYEQQTPESSRPHSPRNGYSTPPATARTISANTPSPESVATSAEYHVFRSHDAWDDESQNGDEREYTVQMMIKTPKLSKFSKSSTTGSQASSDTSWVDVEKDRKRQGEDLEISMAVEQEPIQQNASTLIPTWQIEDADARFASGKLGGQTYMKVLQTIPREYILYHKSYNKLDADKKKFVDCVI